MTAKTDAQIQLDVLRELAQDSRVAPNEVGVEVVHGIVTLTGTVSSYTKRLASEHAAHRVLGVHDVANDLVVRFADGANPNDTEIAAAARHALERSVFVPADRIQTTVANGLVKLYGTVDDAAQREDAARAVQDLAGVCGVDNEIDVKRAQVSKVAVETSIHDALERRARIDGGSIRVEIEAGRVIVSGIVHSSIERQAVVGAAWATRGVEIVIDNLLVLS